MQTLSDQSIRTSRRLDDTYYSILEKVSTLRQTIGTLQELSGLTKELHSNFEADSQDLLDDVKSQFENSGNFDRQQKQVAVLEERVRAGKEKADALTARLAEAKEKVDKRARSEAEWEASTNRTSSANHIWVVHTDDIHRLVAVVRRHSRLYHLAHRHPRSSPSSQAHACRHGPQARA